MKNLTQIFRTVIAGHMKLLGHRKLDNRIFQQFEYYYYTLIIRGNGSAFMV